VRRLGALVLALLAAGVGAGALAYAFLGDESAAEPASASIEDWRWAPKAQAPAREERAEQRPERPDPEPEPEKTVEEPPPPPPEPPPLPDPSTDDAVTRAEVLPNGVALPPLEAPPEVRAIIEAGNTIARHPYKWGGGHGRWQDTGYDCSGSVSYALAAAGLLEAPQASGPLMRWGRPGKGRWLTLYSNPGHVFIVVAGVRFDTSAASRGKTGSRFTNDMRPTAGYAVRHWPGL
jgi:cell wall-associated NlpC family hydrolase